MTVTWGVGGRRARGGGGHQLKVLVSARHAAWAGTGSRVREVVRRVGFREGRFICYCAVVCDVCLGTWPSMAEASLAATMNCARDRWVVRVHTPSFHPCGRKN